MASQSQPFDESSDVYSPSAAPSGDTAASDKQDWSSFHNQTDLEDLKRKVEQLKAQAGASRNKPVILETMKAESSSDDEALLSERSSPFDSQTPRSLYQPSAKPVSHITPSDDLSSDDIRPVFVPKVVEPAITSPLNAATPRPVVQPRATSSPVVAPLAPRFAPASEPAPPTLLKPAVPAGAPAVSTPVPKSMPVGDRPAVTRPAVSQAGLSSVSAEELRGSFKTQAAPRRVGVPYSIFTMTFMYAITVSTVCGYLVFERFNGRPDVLESLPDVPMPSVGGQAGYRLVPASAILPAGHQLSLGKSQRFGHVQITPLKVEQLPVDESQQSAQLVLWVRIENLSSDQTFAPLDDRLMTTKVLDPVQPGVLRSNTFLGVTRDETGFEQAALMLRPSDPRLVKKDPLFGYFPEVAPGEWYETAIVCEPVQITEATRDTFHWRLQLRKGLSVASGQPVTTLVEVTFDPQEVQLPGVPVASR